MINEFHISHWRDIADLEVDFSMEIFRGQSDAKWGLSSSFERTINGTDWDQDWPNTEFWLLREFKKKAGNYLAKIPDANDTLAWMSLMQHHGAPTRLIDFTHSFYIALYFAVVNAKDASAVWAIDPGFLYDVSHSVFFLHKGHLRDEWEDQTYKATNEFFYRLFATASGMPNKEIPIGAAAVEPPELHQRIGSQQGIFVVQFNSEVSFIKNLEPFVEKEGRPIFRKIIISARLREQCMAHLREMNITSETLFPGIDGYARSLVHKKLCL